MATEHDPKCISFQASGDLSTKWGFCVKLHTTADQVALCSGAGDICIGILQNKPAAAGRAASVAVVGGGGVVKAVSDGGTPIAIGDAVGTDANGRVIKKAANNDWTIGRAMDASSAQGTVIRVLMTGGGYFGA